MTASDPMFPAVGRVTWNADGSNNFETFAGGGCSKLLYCMVHAPADEVRGIASHMRRCGRSEQEIFSIARRAWALAMIEESEQ